MGVFLGLPMLEAMLPGVARAQTLYPDAYFVGMFKPLGIARKQFFPKQYFDGQLGTFTGSQWALDGFSTQPLAPHKDVINIFAGAGYPVRGDDHEEEAVRFLTGLSTLAGIGNNQDPRLHPGSIPTQGKSADQLIAQHLFAADNPLRGSIASLQLATDLDFDQPNHNNISYRDKDTPLIPTNDIGRVYDMIFFGFNPNPTSGISEKDGRKRDVLADIWNSSTKSLVNRLGSTDRNSVLAFLQSIDDVRKKIDAMGTSVQQPACSKPAKPGNSRMTGTTIIVEDLEKHYDVMFDLMIIAMQCNRTRVVSYLMEPGRGHWAGRDWSFLIPSIPANAPERAGIEKILRFRDYHEISHYGTHEALGISRNAGEWGLAVIDHFFNRQLAKLISKLKAANLIDKTLLLYSSGFGNPEYHSSISVPCITAGRGMGARTNMLRVFQRFDEYDVTAGPNYYKAAMSRLLVDIMQAFKVPNVNINNFGLRKDESLTDPARNASFGLFG